MRSVLVRYSAAALLFALAIALWLHELVLHPGSRIAGPYGDGTSSIRDYWAISAQHSTPFGLTHDALNGAPEGTARAPAATLAASGLQTVFVWAARDAVGLVGAWNAFLLLGLFATAMATFAFLDRLGCTFAASLFGGLVFGLGPYAVERAYAGHTGLLQNWVLVLVLAALLRLQSEPTYAWAAVAGATIGLAFWISAYEGLLASLMTVVLVAIDVVRPGHRLRSVALGALAFAVAAVMLLPILGLYWHERSAVQAQAGHPLSDLSGYAASLAAYLVPSQRNPLLHHLGAFGRWVLAERPADVTEGTLFAGYTTVALAVVAVVLLLRGRLAEPRRRVAVFAAVLAPVAFLLSFAPSNHVAGISVPAPSWLLSRVTTYWRVYSRFGELVALALAVLAALALTALAARPGRLWKALPLAALALVAIELLPGNPPTIDTSYRPGWVAWLATAPRGTVATYPSIGPRSEELAKRDLWYQHFDGDPRFAIGEGSSQTLMSREQAIRFLARDVTDPLTPRVLETEHVRYAVVHDDVFRAAGRVPPVLVPGAYTLLHRDGDVRIFSVHDTPVDIDRQLRAHAKEIALLEGLVPPSVRFVSGFNAAEPFDGGTGRWMAGDGVIELRNSAVPMRVDLLGLAFSNGVPRLLELQDGSGKVLARWKIPTHAVQFSLGPVEVPAGTSKLKLVTVPGPAPLGGSDPRTASVFLTNVGTYPIPAYAET